MHYYVFYKRGLVRKTTRPLAQKVFARVHKVLFYRTPIGFIRSAINTIGEKGLQRI